MVRVVFLHPDLGIGGAERAVVDAALGLKSRGHHVQMLTAHHDPKHCFEETRDGSLQVTAVGDWLPRSFLGQFYALFAYLRMIYAALYLVFFSHIEYDLVFCDQISACIPFLRLRRSAKVLFYCHFPDMLLTQRHSFLKKCYRAPIDWLEEKTTGMADVILVNSIFTAGVFKETFKSLQHIIPVVVYPIPDIRESSDLSRDVTGSTDLIPDDAKTVFLSINRYERKKNLPLAIKALDELRKSCGGSLAGIYLIIAGGYDERVAENRQHYHELRALTDRRALNDNVIFLRSIDATTKRTLLARSTSLIYTPDREHFGIVPVEAMYARVPVIAVNSGGPRETVVSEETGFLCSQDPEMFASAMERFVKDAGLARRLGENGRKRAVEHFSFDVFTKTLDNVIKNMF